MKQPTDDVTQFHSVDQTTNPTFFAQFMETSHALRTAQVYKQVMMEQLALQVRLFPAGLWWNFARCPGHRRCLSGRTHTLLEGSGAGGTRTALFRQSGWLCGERTETMLKDG